MWVPLPPAFTLVLVFMAPSFHLWMRQSANQTAAPRPLLRQQREMLPAKTVKHLQSKSQWPDHRFRSTRSPVSEQIGCLRKDMGQEVCWTVLPLFEGVLPARRKRETSDKDRPDLELTPVTVRGHLLQLRILGFGLLQDKDVGTGSAQ